MDERMTAIVGARIHEFERKMAKVNAISKKVASHTVKKIGADTKEFNYKMFGVYAALSQLKEKTVVEIDARINKFQSKMSKIANNMRSFGTVAGNGFMGGFISVLPSLSPIIGTLVGGAGALASSFTAAFGGLGAFAIAAIGNAGKLGDSMKEIKKINDKIASATDQEKINELLKARSGIMSKLSGEQKSAMKQINKFKGAWGDFLKVTEKPVFQVFAAGLKAATSLLGKIKPIIKPVADSLTWLLNKFNAFSETKQFKSFINFFATRGSSAIKNWGIIAGNVLNGFMELMKAFAPLGLDMENGLIGLTEKFSKWAKSLSESKSFQKFINFVKTNVPKVLSLIGNITTFIVNLGIGMAPLGSKILDIVNGFLGWINGMMKASPLIGQVIAWVVSLSGILLALVPGIVLVQSAFGGMASLIWLKTGMMRAKLITGVGMMIKSLGKFIAKMATTVAKMVTKSALFIAKWALIGAKATLNAGKAAAAWTLATGKKLAVASGKMIATSAMFVTKWALMGTKSALGAGKVAAAWALSTGKAMVTSMAKMVAQSAIFVAKWVWVGAQSLIQAARVAAAWFIALGPVGWVIATVIALVGLIIANWDKIKKWTIKAWNKIWGWIKDTWDKIWDKIQIVIKIYKLIKGKFSDIAGAIKEKMNDAWDKITEIWDDVMTFFENIDLKQTGKDIIQGLVNGLGAAKDWVTKKVKEVAGSIKDTLMFWTDSHSPSKMTEKIGGFVGQGLGNGIIDKIKTVKNAAKNLAKAAIPNVQKFKPNLALADVEMSNMSVDTQMDELKRQIKQELKVDLVVHQKNGQVGTSGDGVTQNITINSPTPLSPSETARKQKQASQRLAMEWGV